MYVCCSIALERLERFQPNLVHMTIYYIYICIKLLRLYTIARIHSFSCLIEDWDMYIPGQRRVIC
jgi:hypothetical protein